MNKFFLFLFFCSISHLAICQSEKLDVEGAIIISDSEDSTPIAGTIRWTGQDFEGFDGMQWKSLTCDCSSGPNPGLCPDSRFVSHTILTVTQSSIQIRVETIQSLPLRISYYPSANPSQIQYGNCEPSQNYGAPGNAHVQNLTGLSASTAYTFIVQTSQNIGSSSGDCPNMVWEDISCPISISTN